MAFFLFARGLKRWVTDAVITAENATPAPLKVFSSKYLTAWDNERQWRLRYKYTFSVINAKSNISHNPLSFSSSVSLLSSVAFFLRNSLISLLSVWRAWVSALLFLFVPQLWFVEWLRETAVRGLKTTEIEEKEEQNQQIWTVSGSWIWRFDHIFRSSTSLLVLVSIRMGKKEQQMQNQLQQMLKERREKAEAVLALLRKQAPLTLKQVTSRTVFSCFLGFLSVF